MAQDALLSEVDRDLREEKIRQFWRANRTLILSVVVLLIIATSGISIWRDHQQKKAGLAMAQLDHAILALQGGKPEEAATAFAALANEQHGELRDLALLWQGRALQMEGNSEAANAAWKQLADKPEGDDLVWRDLACLRLLKNAAAPESCATVTPSPLKSERLEWQAATLWREGKMTEAQDLLQAIIDDKTASNAQHARATRLIAALDSGK
jgi:hypothetical protein